MQVFLLPQPYIITDNGPLISLISWHVLPYVCKSANIRRQIRRDVWEGSGADPCLWETKLQVMTIRERGHIYHCAFHKSCCEMPEEQQKGNRPHLNPCERWRVSGSAGARCINIRKAAHQGGAENHFTEFLSSALTCTLLANNISVNSHSEVAVTDTLEVWKSKNLHTWQLYILVCKHS